MSQFLNDLHFSCIEALPAPQDPVYQEALNALESMDRQIRDALGKDFLRHYEQALQQVQELDALESFRAGLRFAAQLALELSGHSSQISAPKRPQAAFMSPQA